MSGFRSHFGSSAKHRAALAVLHSMQWEVLAVILALAFLGFLGGVCATATLLFARTRMMTTDVQTTKSSVDLMHVFTFHDWTVEGLKALWLHFKLGPHRHLWKLELEQGLSSHMANNGIEMMIITTRTTTSREPTRQQAE